MGAAVGGWRGVKLRGATGAVWVCVGAVVVGVLLTGGAVGVLAGGVADVEGAVVEGAVDAGGGAVG